MPIKTSRFPDKQLTLIEAYGEVTIHQAENTLIDYYAGGVTKLALWDFTFATGVGSPTDEIDELVQFARERTPNRPEGSRIAVVVPTDLGYGVTRVVGALCEFEGLPFEIQGFRSREEAMAWLGVTIDQF